MDADRPLSEELKGSGDGGNTPLSDTPLPDLPDALVNDRDRVVAAEAPGTDYSTMSACYESRRVYRPMRGDLEEYRGVDVDVDEQGYDAGDVAEMVTYLEQRVVVREIENLALREAVEAHAEQARLVVHWRTSRLQLLTLSRQCQY